MAVDTQKSRLSPAQRAILFAQATRKYEQGLPSQKFAESTTLQWQFPKTRFLSKITLIVKGKFTAAHAAKTSFTKSVFDKYNLIRRIRMSINNGFNPYDISGQMICLYNWMNKPITPSVDNFGVDALENVVSVPGTENDISFKVELPITINDRDPVGLVLLQNEQTIVTLNVDTSVLKSIMTDADITLSAMDITITPVLETFSVPTIPDAVPDYSIVKLVNEQSENIVSTNQMTVKLPIGLTYRKFFLYLASDASYTPIDPVYISNFSLVFNQADSPVNIPADYVIHKNRDDYNGKLPKGCYAFDFSSQGIANYGGGRDYVDTERLTECWVKIDFNGLLGATNYVYLGSEKLAKTV